MYRHVYLSGETIGMCVGSTACRVSVARLVGGLGLSGVLSELVSDIVSSCLEVAVRFSVNKGNGFCKDQINRNRHLFL